MLITSFCRSTAGRLRRFCSDACCSSVAGDGGRIREVARAGRDGGLTAGSLPGCGYVRVVRRALCGSAALRTARTARFRTGGTEPDTRLGGGGAAGNGAAWRGGLSLWVGHADAARD